MNMMIRHQTIRSAFQRMIRNRQGNFALTTALVLPVLLAGVGVAVDLANMSQYRANLQDAADSSALAAASAMAAKGMNKDDAKQLAIDFINGQLAKLGDNGVADPDAKDKDLLLGESVTITQSAVNGTGKLFNVKVNIGYDVPLSGFTSLLGWQTAHISVSSTSESQTETKNALSMYMVLDRSGSMAENTDNSTTTTSTYSCGTTKNPKTCTKTTTTYVTKIEALKTAVATLVQQLDTADPDKKYVRTGAISYNNVAQSPTNLAWGTSGITTYVNALTATGTTNSGGAFETSEKALIEKPSGGKTENDEHLAKNGQKDPSKFIVFMTDGENNVANADTLTKKWCDTAKTNGIEVYTVAFMAPTAGKNLLKYCASSTAHYFDANDADDIVAAFKNIGQKAAALTNRIVQ